MSEVLLCYDMLITDELDPCSWCKTKGSVIRGKLRSSRFPSRSGYLLFTSNQS